MNAPRYVVGIDCGTQSAKVLITDANGATVATGRCALAPMLRPRPGVVQHPDDDLWTAIGAATRDAVASLGDGARHIAAVGICPIRCCKAFLAEDGTLVEPLMSWMDDRAYQPYLPADSRLRWAMTASGYIAHRFTGKASDAAANCIDSQWPIDVATRDWSDDAAVFARFGLRRELVADLAQPGDVIGSLTGAAALHTGLPESIPVVQTANDKAVEALGVGPMGDRTVLVSLGTYIASMMPGRHVRTGENVWTNFASVPGRFLHESGGIRRGMWTISWLLELFGPEFAARASAEGVTREALIEPEAAAAPAGSDGLVSVLDWLAPGDAPYRRGSMLGFDARHTRGHLYRSVMEAIAVTMRINVDRMCADLSVEPDEVLISGGGAQSPLFSQIFADAFERPLQRVLEGGASLGSAICASVACGVHPDFDTAARAMAPPRIPVGPDARNAAAYRRLLPLVRDARTFTDPLYRFAAEPN